VLKDEHLIRLDRAPDSDMSNRRAAGSRPKYAAANQPSCTTTCNCARYSAHGDRI